MKKITLLLIFLISFSGYCQIFPEGFENTAVNQVPAGWGQYQNLSTLSQKWKVGTANACDGSKAAAISPEGLDPGATSEQYLVTPQFTVAANGEVRFSVKQGNAGDQGSKFQVRVSADPNPTTLASYIVVKEWAELDMDPGTAPICHDLKASLADYAGQKVYVAFVTVFTQPSDLSIKGDRWSVDKVDLGTQCVDPTKGVATNIAATTATLSWTNTTGALWDIEYVFAGDTPTGTPSVSGVTSNPYNAINLTPDKDYNFYVRSVCSDTNKSNWAGPFSFKTYPLGVVCIGAIPVTSLPYQTSANTANFQDLFDGPQDSSSLCGANPPGTDYLAGNDVFYSYTATETGTISIKMTPTGPNSSVFVYGSCPATGACLYGSADATANQRYINNIHVTAGSTYTILISSASPIASPTQTVGYTLVIQKETCTPPVGSSPATADVTMTTAKLSWTNPTGATEWEVAVQAAGSAVPTGAGEPATNPFTKTGLTSGTKYQYFVRSKCASGEFSSWAGPYTFNTLICEDKDKCNYTFSMTDTGNNGWGGAVMKVRQNGIEVGSIGSTFVSGGGPVDVTVALCNNVDFDLYWETPGLQPQQCQVAVINKFGQTLYTKTAGTGKAGDILYTGKVICDKPVCDIPPISLNTTTLGTHGATLSWSAPATTAWDVYVVPQGSPAPNVLTTPTYAGGTTTNPFPVSGLLADTCYDFYVRVVCDTKSDWSVAGTFCTLPTCPRPVTTTTSVTAVTKTSATFSWTNGTPGDAQWEILLIKAAAPDYGVPAVPAANYVPQSGDKFYTVSTPSPYTVNNLDPATIYYYYIRTVCAGNDKSVWAAPVKFNTITCDDTAKCVYQFKMTDSGNNNGWELGRMQVRQNGILISPGGSIGATMTSSKPVYVNLNVCNNVSLELVWTNGGTHPEEIGVQVISPNQDPLYTKLPGQGNPLDLLFKTTGDCSTPSCIKPTSPNVTNITASTADLSWTEMGTPAATQWEIYVVPSGTSQPANGSAVVTVNVVGTNPYTVKGLNPSTDYDFYVRSLCSSTNASTWTLLNPVKFTTVPVNDDCTKAISVPVNSDENCVAKASGNTRGATGPLTDTSGCQGFADDDVWFSFVATSKIHVIDITNIVGEATDLNHTVYSGNDCATQTLLYCSSPNTSVASNLTIGNTYRIKVYTDVQTVKTDLKSATFDVCITTPPPIVNDNCDTAIALTVNDDLACAQSKSGTLTGATASLQPNTCIGTADDDVWYKFVATTYNHYIMLSNVTGSSIDVNHAVYTGNCGNLVLKYCSAGNSLKSTANDFIIGQTYYVRIWSNLPVAQKINFDICIGSVPPPIITNTSKTAQQLVEDVLLGSKCANVTNVHSSTGTDFSSVNGIGYFTKSLSSFPFKDGIVLSTGNALSVPGPSKQAVLSEGSASWLGDKDLEAIIKEAVPNQVVDSYNASVLEFDFTPLTPHMSFNFLFASEEYGTFQCSFADAFAFILSHTENGVTTKQNLAIVPGTTNLPVSVVTIRDGKYNGNCPSQHADMFDQYFGTDGKGLDPLGAPIDFNGFTVPLKAEADVTPGQVYHIKMVIADNKDKAYDSAVFLEGGSFEIGKIDFGADLLISTKNALCFGEKHIIDSGLEPSKYTFIWKKNNTVIDGQTGPSLAIDSEGTYTLEAHYLNGICDASDSIVVEYYPNTAPGTPSNLSVCGTSKTAVFDLTKNSGVILSPYNGDHTVDYYASADDANSGQNVIPNPSTFQNTSSPQTIYARVNTIDSRCYQIVTFTATAGLVPQFTVSGGCTSNDYELTATPDGASYDPATATYEWTSANGGTVTPTDKKNTVILKGLGTYDVKVTTADGCSATETTTVTDVSCSIQKGISPGSDTKNSSFDLTTLNAKRLEVFNRYGSEVYSKDNYTNEWHGQSNSGSDLPDGTYFYQVHLMDNKTTTGWVYINRKQS